MMGNILRGEGNDTEAAEHMRNYLKIEPNGPDAAKVQEYLATIEQGKGRPAPLEEQH
jgi:hypothetical protein